MTDTRWCLGGVLWVAAGLLSGISVTHGGDGRDGWGCWEPSGEQKEREEVCRLVARRFALAPAAPGKGLGSTEWNALLDQHHVAWRADPSAPLLVPLFSEDEPAPRHHRFFLSLEALCRAMPRATEEQQRRLTAILAPAVEHYASEWSRWRNEGGARRGRPPFPVYGIADYRLVMREATRLSVSTREGLAETLFDHLAWNHEHVEPDVQMDYLKAMVAYLPWVPMLAEGRKREELIGRTASYYDRMIRCGRTFSPDGAIIHHGIWHYAYASYSLPQFLDNVSEWHRCGLFLSRASRDHLRRAALVAAVLSDNAPRATPFNVEGRSGGMPRIGPMTDHLLRTAALLGDDESPTRLWMPAAQVLNAIHPKAAAAAEFADVIGSRQPLTGVWPVNRGGALIVHQPGWTVAVGGLSPLTGKHEIYSWTQHNNHSIFIRRGGMTIISNEGNGREADLGYALEAGFDWSRIPGTTTELRTAEQLFSRRRNTFVSNSGMAAACGIGEAGLWALDQAVGPGPSFRKSVHAVGGRLTCVTTAVQRDDPRAARPRIQGILPSQADAVPLTTMFQWPCPISPGQLAPDARTQPVVRQHANGSESLADRHGHAYVVHPQSHGVLQVTREKQSQTLSWDRFLREGETPPIDWNRWTVEGAPLEKADFRSLESRYMPREGWFDIATLSHGLTAPPEGAATVYSLLPLTDDTTAARFAESLTTPDTPIEILAATEAHHAVRHSDSLLTIAVFLPSEDLPGDLPIRSASQPCTIILRGPRNSLSCAIAWNPPQSAAGPLTLSMRGRATIRGTVGTAETIGDTVTLVKPAALPWEGVLGFAD